MMRMGISRPRTQGTHSMWRTGSSRKGRGRRRRYAYDHAGKRVLKSSILGTTELYFYGITGQKLATATCTGGSCGSLQYNVYFGGKLVKSKGVVVVTDRLGSVRANSNGEYMTYYPYGEEKTSTADNREKFGPYMRDSTTQDYADQRYYAVGMGRFNSADPSTGSDASDPSSWNKYAYVSGDPIAFNDPRGRYKCTVGAGEGVEIVDCEDVPLPSPQRPAPPRPIHVTNARKDGEDYLKVQDAFALTMASLDPNCEAFLNSGQGPATNVSSAVRSYVSDLFAEDMVAVANFQGNIAAFTGSGGTDLPDGYAAITFNTASAFFKDGFTVDNGKIQGGSNQAQVFIILHELGHALNATDFLPDKNDAEAGKSNDKLIETNCSKTLASLK
jgi:RHS repeat-associated protein